MLAAIKSANGRIQQSGKTKGTPLAIPAGVAELFACRLSSIAGIRVAPVTLTPDEPTDFSKFHAKRVPGGWMLSARIEKSIPLFFLKGASQILPPEDEGMGDAIFRGVFESLFDKRCPLSRESYLDFPVIPPEVSLKAARWDSEQRMMQHAFRSFLWCSHAHSSNALVDTKGRLYLIDHEKTYYARGTKDIAELHEVVNCSDSALRICRKIGEAITPDAIRCAFEDIDRRFGLSPPLRAKHLAYILARKQQSNISPKGCSRGSLVSVRRQHETEA